MFEAREVVERFDSRMRSISAATASMTGLHEVLFQAGSDDLAAAMESLDAMAAQLDAARVMVTAEAAGRGVISASTAASVTQWVGQHGRHLEPGEAHRVATVAAAVQEPRNGLLAASVREGKVSTRCAAVTLREVDKIAPLVPDASREEALGWFLQVGHEAGSRELAQLATWIVGRFGGNALELAADKARRLSGVNVARLPSGVTRYVMDLCPEHSAIIDAGLEGLSAPRTTTDPETGQVLRDTRLAPQRRAEAMVEIFTRAAAADRARSITGTTKLVVMVQLSDLTAGVGGVGTTLTGQQLDAGTVRRLACDAEVIPAVLGADSELLDVGREQRLFEGGVRTSVVVRDRRCTFPHCGRPAPWCRVHHVRHWLDGGRTRLLNGALLCEAHHVVVHQLGLTATVTASKVTWHR